MLTIQQRIGGQNAAYDKFKESIFSDLHVAMIGVVTSVDSSTGLISVKPVINDRIVNNDGSTVWVEYPVIQDIPYVGDTPVTGSSVLLIFCDNDISGIMNSTGTDSTGTASTLNQEILRKHSLSDAVAITGLSLSSSASADVNYSGDVPGSRADNGSGVSDALINLIKSHEGCVLNWYDDGFGYQTIGYGHMSQSHTLPNGITAPLTQATATQLLTIDVSSRVSFVKTLFSGITLKQNQIDALTDFAFALGTGTLQNSSVAKDIKAGVTDSSKLKADFETYCHVNGKVNKQVLKLRTVEWNIYCNNTYTW